MTFAVEDVVNQALRDGGVPLRIADIYEGSEAAKTALELYGQTRDTLLRSTDWSFSRRVAALSLLKGPPPAGGYNPAQPWSTIYPYPGFLYEYSYPSDCLDLRAVIEPPGPMPDLDPLPALWRVDNDLAPIVSGAPPVASGPAAKVILCNMTNAIGVYRARVTDMTTWEPGFTASLVSILGKRFAVAFGADANTAKEESAQAGAVTQLAASIRG